MTHPINGDGTIDFDGVAHILYDGRFEVVSMRMVLNCMTADLKDREVIEEYLETTK